MKLSDFDYPLPKEKIALFPDEQRTGAKLLCIDKVSGVCSHRVFSDLPGLLNPTDLLVLNNTKVLPARLFGKKVTGGKVEALLLKEVGANVWETLLKPGGRIKDGERITFIRHPEEDPRPDEGSQGGILRVAQKEGSRSPVHARSGGGDEAISLVGTVIASAEPHSGKRRIRFEGADVKDKIKKLGHIPLPPYIDRDDIELDRSMYQTVFAEKEGAVASPTAGLHFDDALLEKIRRKGVEIVPVTLHVSYGTFQPIAVEEIERHKMFEEEYEITEDAAARINKAKREGRRVVVCGTTCVRALESAANLIEPRSQRGVVSGRANTSIFIHPPYEFKIVDALITNFHMPKSTLLVMVAAFLDYDKMMNAYNTALREDYRFASYGDAMFIA
ncbi:MAG TPA: tRNA preQ1(34) S-adenosylmethionine ribosyltransferase-isomerase QueA [Candidatus Omnitrophota bacterium]|nr:tRNA preQ1(34) S-adenosylmethionine ribosyltransferase-isomerase QueA [Candidatus Omnitrophota bacterium]HPS36422.1 tRNA preQ1(34) S-adenosylmethionine ribosyltransferase-isomerase QueA [Candidatus Omnitrophota bacterium]